MTSPALQDEAPAASKAKPILASAWKPAEARRNVWSVIVDANMTQAELLQSATWSVMSTQLQFLDRLEVCWADRSGFAELIVIAAGLGHATVHLLSYTKLPSILTCDPDSLPNGFDVVMAGPVGTDGTGGYTVIRLCDQVVMTQGHGSKASAINALLSHASLR